jgi:hypothetical protein
VYATTVVERIGMYGVSVASYSIQPKTLIHKKMNDVLKLAKEFPALKLEVSAEDLLTMMRTITEETVERFTKVEKQEQYLTRKQTANMLDVDLSTLWRWDKESYLLTVAIGGKRRYKLSDVERILRGRS